MNISPGQIENVIADYLPVLKRMPTQSSNDLMNGLLRMQQYGVESFSSRIIYPDGYSSTFCTSISWAEIKKTDQFKEEFRSHISPEITKLYKNKTNIISRSADKINTNFLKTLEGAGLNNSIIITEFFKDYIQVTYFTADPKKPEDRDLIINNIQGLLMIRKNINSPLQDIYSSKEFKNKKELLLNSDARVVIWDQTYNRIKQSNLTISSKFSVPAIPNIP